MSQWKITYMGEGVTALDGVGVFARHTTARVAEGVATKLKGDARWVIVAPDGATSGPAPAAAAPVPAKEEKKADDKKADAPKADDKKADDKKADAPKADDKKKADEKPADKPKA